MQDDTIVLHGLVDLARGYIIERTFCRRVLIAMGENDAKETWLRRALWNILWVRINMDIACKIGKISPSFTFLGTQIATFATSIEVQEAFT